MEFGNIISVALSVVGILISVYVACRSTSLLIKFETKKKRLEILKRFVEYYSKESYNVFVNEYYMNWIDLYTEIAVYFSKSIYVAVRRLLYYVNIYKKWRKLKEERVMIEKSTITFDNIYNLIYKKMLSEINDENAEFDLENLFNDLNHLDSLNNTTFEM